MNYAVIKTGGKQYKVSEGDILEVDRLKEEKNGKIVFNDVLLLVRDDAVTIGKPTINGEKVEAKVLDNVRGEKIRVSKFKAKVRYRKVTGFRASLSRIQIDKIGNMDKVKPEDEKDISKTAKKK